MHTAGNSAGIQVRTLAVSLILALVASILVTAGAIAAASAASAAVPGPAVGVQFHGTWGDYTDAQRAQVLDTLKANGATTVRIDVSWRQLEPTTPGVFDTWGLNNVNNAITMAATRGLKPLVTLWMTPKWATGSDNELTPPTTPAALTALTDVAKRLAAKYNGTVDAWEVWNEPNDTGFLPGADPGVYANILKAANAGFKAGSPTTPVVFGGASYVDAAWVDRALAAGAAGNYDIMGIHPYQGVADEAPEAPDNGTIWRLNHLPALINTMAKYGEGAKQIWFTEFGWRAHVTLTSDGNWQRGVSPATQADYLARTITLVRTTYPTVTRLYWYKDRADSANPNEAQYGLIYPDGTPAPALKNLPAALGTTPTVTTPSAPGSVSVTTKSGYAIANWKAPAGSTVTSYRVELRQVNSTAVTVVTVPSGTLSAKLTTRRGVSYQVAVAAVNSAGTSPFTVSSSFTGR